MHKVSIQSMYILGSCFDHVVMMWALLVLGVEYIWLKGKTWEWLNSHSLKLFYVHFESGLLFLSCWYDLGSSVLGVEYIQLKGKTWRCFELNSVMLFSHQSRGHTCVNRLVMLTQALGLVHSPGQYMYILNLGSCFGHVGMIWALLVLLGLNTFS